MPSLAAVSTIYLFAESRLETQTQTAAEVRDFARATPLSTGDPDSPLERRGFEPPVPVRQAKLTRSCR